MQAISVMARMWVVTGVSVHVKVVERRTIVFSGSGQDLVVPTH